MEVDAVLVAVAARWGVDTTGAVTVSDGARTVVRLPAAGVAVHIARQETTDERVALLQTARRRLEDEGIPVVGLLPTRDGATWSRVGGRVVEVEAWVEHDGRMNTWPLLERGVALLAGVHDAWADLESGPAGEACTWANTVPRGRPPTGLAAAEALLRRGGHGGLAADIRRLGDLTASATHLPEQLVHGDFWDDNLYVRGDDLVAVTDFDFVGRRPRVDDLALTMYFADEQPTFDGVGHRPAAVRRAELAALVSSYAHATRRPLSGIELGALPRLLARQPLWRFAKWMLLDPDPRRALDEALATAPAVARALETVDEEAAWSDAFAASAVRHRPDRASSVRPSPAPLRAPDSLTACADLGGSPPATPVSGRAATSSRPSA